LQKEYYTNNLYPFQDKIFDEINNLNVNLYLTGGTALSRFYLNHRYSDDLDFFANNSKTFIKDKDLIILKLKENFDIEVIRKTADFERANARKGDLLVKLDFVNDVEYRSGNTESFEKFKSVDNWWNIFSNKLTALERLEPKDIADILFLWRKYKIDWKKAFEEAGKKVNYIDPLDISVLLDEFPIEYLEKISWVEEIDYAAAQRDIKKMAKEILESK
jgi:predicted nucleotidyltransferase component of viral defense system